MSAADAWSRVLMEGAESQEWTDPRRALTDAFDLIEEMHKISYASGVATLTMEEVSHLDARVEEMRKRVEAITGEERS